MAKKKVMKLSQGLVLNRYLLSLFGVTNLEAIAKEISSSHLEGWDENNVSRIYHHLCLHLFDANVLTKEMLFEYDQNIYSHTSAISEKREQPIQWKYFQYFTLLLVEIYLDRYFSSKQKLLEDLNNYVTRFNDLNDHDVPNDFSYKADKYTFDNLNKIAIWSATGSGKTLMLHINIKQYLHYAHKYNKKDHNKVLLITPNEGLSAQHLKEMEESNMEAEIFNQESGGIFAGKQVEILEISKLAEEGGDKTVAVDAFETNNLVLIDEGHRGAGGDEWKRRRDILSETGFAFEYSATFGQAVSAAAGPKKTALMAEYSKSIISDYSYKFFYNDGYGKDYRILNIQEEPNSEYHTKYLTACLLSFYQQLVTFGDNKKALADFLLEKPLWIFVGGKVTKSLNKDVASDVVNIITFISDFIKHSQTSKEHIAQILNSDAGLVDNEGHDIFRSSFSYLKNKAQDIEMLYRDILLQVFNTTLVGANVHIDNLKGVDGELGLRIGDTNDYFGVINVGDDATLHKLCIEAGILGMDKEFSQSLFKNINEKGSKINLLIGSKKFTEGWSSWRVSTMGLMNIGKGEGSQIIQLFGRGVRLKGYQMSLKRSTELDDYQRPKEKLPSYLSSLETLSIFGIKADYMQQFKDYLIEEGLTTDQSDFVKVVVPTVVRYQEEISPLRLVQTPKGAEKGYKKKNITTLEWDEKAKNLNINLDWYPKIQMMAAKSDESIADGKQTGIIEAQHLAFVDWNKVYFAIQKYKNERSWYNLSVSISGLKEIIRHHDWYELYIPHEDLAVSHFSKIAIWEDIVITLLKMYTERYYLKDKNQYMACFIETATMDANHPNFIEEYEVKINKKSPELIDKVEKLSESIRNNEAMLESHKLLNDFVAFDYDRHLFWPLMYFKDKKEYKDKVKLNPVGLNEGEKELVDDLKKYLLANPKFTDNKEIYLLRNQSKTGLGFLTETVNFYPDFILWQVVGDKQYISLIDPKGIVHLKDVMNHPKVQLCNTIKTEFQARLKDKETFLNSFIISNTNFETIKRGEEEITDYHNVNIYFQQEDRATYIGEVLKKGMLE